MKIPIFSKTIPKIKKSHEQKVFFFSILHMLCQFHQDRSINKKLPPKNGSVPLTQEAKGDRLKRQSR